MVQLLSYATIFSLILNVHVSRFSLLTPSKLLNVTSFNPRIVSSNLASEPPFVTVRIPMRDGVELVADYFVKSTTQKYPAILEITPYGRILDRPNFRNEAEYWINSGYAFVIADARGTGDSGGEFPFLTQDGPDGHDVVEWIAKQSWCNGRVGMRGASYSGGNQWYTAREKPPHLLCITPSETPANMMNDVPYRNGVFNLLWALNWVGLTLAIPYPPAVDPHPDPKTWLNQQPLRSLDRFVIGRNLPLYQTFLDHPTYDSYWDATVLKPEDFERIDIPTLAFTGWYDSTLLGTVESYAAIRKYSPRKNDHFLIIGPYSHATGPDGGYDYLTDLPVPSIGDISIPSNGLLPARNMTREFYDWCLKNGSRPNWPLTRTYVPIADVWLTSDRFPLSQTQQRSLYLTSGGHANGLHGDGRLQWKPPVSDQVDHYVYDPMNPIFIPDNNQSYEYPVNINTILEGDDVLVYTSDVLTEPLTVIGEVNLDLRFSTTGYDTDIVIQLMDVTPNGQSIKLGPGFCFQSRLRYRDGFESEKPADPNMIYTITIPLEQIGHTFLVGHRVRLAIMSSFYPWLNANKNTGDSIGDSIATPMIVNQSVYHSSLGISRIRLTVMETPTRDTFSSCSTYYLGVLNIIQYLFLFYILF